MQTFKSFADLGEHLRADARKKGHCFPKQVNKFHPHLAFSVTLQVDAAIPNKTKGGVRLGRINGTKMRVVNLSANALTRYTEHVGGKLVKFSGRDTISKVCSGLGVR